MGNRARAAKRRRKNRHDESIITRNEQNSESGCRAVSVGDRRQFSGRLRPAARAGFAGLRTAVRPAKTRSRRAVVLRHRLCAGLETQTLVAPTPIRPCSFGIKTHMAPRCALRVSARSALRKKTPEQQILSRTGLGCRPDEGRQQHGAPNHSHSPPQRAELKFWRKSRGAGMVNARR